MTKVIFFGASQYVLPLLAVLQENFDLALVVTTETLPTEPVSSYCKTHSIKIVTVKHLSNETIATIKEINAPIAVLADFGRIIPKDILTLFPNGIINIHPSLLPLYRGPTPGQSAILAGETETGVTIIKLDSDVDHGSILAQEQETIHRDDTADTLYKRLFQKGADLLLPLLHMIEAGQQVEEHPQDHTKATFTKRLSRQSGYFDSNTPPSRDQLDRMIRAYYPWPGVWTKMRIRNQELRIKFLPQNSLQVEGKKPVSYKDFLNGYPQLKDTYSTLFQEVGK